MFVTRFHQRCDGSWQRSEILALGLLGSMGLSDPAGLDGMKMLNIPKVLLR